MTEIQMLTLLRDRSMAEAWQMQCHIRILEDDGQENRVLLREAQAEVERLNALIAEGRQEVVQAFNLQEMGLTDLGKQAGAL